MFSNFGNRLFKDESQLDDARYIAVATGRLEPYKRVLAQETLFISGNIPLIPDQLQIETDGTSFLKLWATRNRAKKTGLKKIQSTTFHNIYQQLEKTVASDKNSLYPIFTTGELGILIDAGLANEIYIEPHQIAEIYDLSRHLPVPAAFIPIARESLSIEQKISVADIKLPEPLKPIIPTIIPANYCCIKLNGLYGESWNLLFLETNQVDFNMLENLKIRYPQWLIIPRNCSINWVNDILEQYRSEAIPISLENHA